jgi:DNA-directed RNA polymerase specialized sigma24 family protein
LSEEYRVVLMLRAEGLKYSEIAAQLGINLNTVATRLRRATQAVARQVRGRTECQPYVAVSEQGISD